MRYKCSSGRCMYRLHQLKRALVLQTAQALRDLVIDNTQEPGGPAAYSRDVMKGENRSAYEKWLMPNVSKQFNEP